MAGLTDAEAVLADFEAWLVEDGRASHGTAHLTQKLAELRAQHRRHEDQERETLRLLAADLQDVFLGLMPLPATRLPLGVGDLRAPAAMEARAAIRSDPEREDSCQNQYPPNPRSRSLPTPA